MKRWIVAYLCGCALVGCSGAKESPSVAPDPVVAEAAAPAAVEADGQPSRYAGYQLTGEPEMVEALAMTVDDTVITVGDIFDPIRIELDELGRTAGKEEFLKRAGELIGEEIQRQVGEALVYADAVKNLSEPEMAYVDGLVADRLRDMIVSVGGSRSKLVEQMRAEGLDLDDYLRQYQRTTVTRMYLSRRITPTLNVSRKEMWRYYVTHADEFDKPGRVKMQVMAFPFKAYYPTDVDSPGESDLQRASQQARAAAAKAIEKIRGGEDFGQVVRAEAVSPAWRSAKGGVMDLMAAGSLREVALETAAFGQEAGQVSDIVMGRTGAYIVKTLELDVAEVVSFEKAQETIGRKLRDRQYNKRVAEFYGRIEQRAVISQAEAFGEAAQMRAIQLFFSAERKR